MSSAVAQFDGAVCSAREAYRQALVAIVSSNGTTSGVDSAANRDIAANAGFTLEDMRGHLHKLDKRKRDCDLVFIEGKRLQQRLVELAAEPAEMARQIKPLFDSFKEMERKHEARTSEIIDETNAIHRRIGKLHGDAEHDLRSTAGERGDWKDWTNLELGGGVAQSEYPTTIPPGVTVVR